jgi:MinD superfamily P-loop ATPase
MKLAIASGKGGTGKTTLATNLATVLTDGGAEVQLLDCDAEEPNAHLFFNPLDVQERTVHSQVPIIDNAKCDLCGKCVRICAFRALAVVGESVLVFPEMCHGCGGCAKLCPQGAITEVPRQIGVVVTTQVRGLGLVWGRSEIGLPLVPAVIKEVHREAQPDASIVVDAAPGTSCAAVAAVTSCDVCLLVTEPTPFGLHDLKLAVAMADELGLPTAAVINRVGLGDDSVAEYCRRQDIPVLLEIPFDRQLAACYAQGHLWVDQFPEWRREFANLWEKLLALHK